MTQKSKNYFSKETQEKIVLYQNEENKTKKHQLYEEHISPAFVELVQSLVSVYRFKATNEDLTHLKNDCTSFLFEQLHKWKPEKGTKAFSYFNVVGKNWLTIQTRKLNKLDNKNVFFEDKEKFTLEEKNYLTDLDYFEDVDHEEKYNQYVKNIYKVIDYIEKNLSKENDLKCAYAIKTVFKNANDLEFLNKRAIFVYLREISGLNSTELSSSLSSIRRIYRKVVGPDNLFFLMEE